LIDFEVDQLSKQAVTTTAMTSAIKKTANALSAESDLLNIYSDLKAVTAKHDSLIGVQTIASLYFIFSSSLAFPFCLLAALLPVLDSGTRKDLMCKCV
jgi:hypothetical protein